MSLVRNSEDTFEFDTVELANEQVHIKICIFLQHRYLKFTKIPQLFLNLEVTAYDKGNQSEFEVKNALDKSVRTITLMQLH